MNMHHSKLALSCVFAIVTASGVVSHGAEPLFHLSRDFSLASNPNGPWSYGYSSNLGAQSLFTVARYTSDPFECWTVPANIPAVFRNATSNTVVNGGGGIFEPGVVFFHAGADGSGNNFGVLRLTVPSGASGPYRLETAVRPAYPASPQGDTDFHVLRNGVELFGRFLAPSESAGYTNILLLGAGDTIDFAVGRGADGREYGSLLKIHATLSLDVTNPPSITAQPASQTVTEGGSATFSVTALGTPPLTYQWRFNGDDISGGTGTSLTLFNVQPSAAGNYSVVVANAVGAVTSQVAVLTVQPPPVVVRLADVAAVAGGEAVVPVQLEARGQENAVAASVTFDSALLALAGVALDPAMPAGSSLIVNSNSAAVGRLGFAVALPANTTFPAGLQNLVQVRFAVAPVLNPVSIPVGFGDQPTTRQVADALAGALPAVFVPGTVTVAASTVSVVSTTAGSGGEARVSVRLQAQGHENAAAFSLNFDPALLSFVAVEPGNDVPAGGAMVVNTNAVAMGRVGLAIGLAAGTTFDAGAREIAVLRLAVAPVLNPFTNAIAFGDQPTARQLSDAQARVVPSVFVDGTLAVVQVQFEGDVAPRPGGDRSLTLIDWVQMGRFVAGLDTPGSPGEFQRADCAPLANKGNGAISLTDYVQAGRFTVGLDPLTPAGGPDSAGGGGGGGGGGGNFVPAEARTLSIQDSSSGQGQTNEIPVMLMASGAENAMSFSLVYDAAKVRFLGAIPGLGAPGAALTLNTNQAGSGRVGVVLALAPGSVFQAGTREVLRARFLTLMSAPASATLTFGDQPVLRETSDALANTLATMYSAGTVTVALPPGPPLQYTRTGNSLYITWPTSPAGFELESSASIVGPTWTPVSGVINLGSQKLAIVSIEGDRRFFRLKQP